MSDSPVATTNGSSNDLAAHLIETKPPEKPQQQDGEQFAKNECYICKGIGHWARNCTSLPSVYLVENPPKCYNCHGIGHYARFCPNVLMGKSPMFRRRANSEPIAYLYNAPHIFGFAPVPPYPDDETVYFYDQPPVVTYGYDVSVYPGGDSPVVIIEEDAPRSALEEAQNEAASIDIIVSPPSPPKQHQQQ